MKFQIMRSFLLTLVLFVNSFQSFGQEQSGRIIGTVRDAVNGDLLPSANIVLKGISQGTLTDFDGNYELKVVPGTYGLVVSYMGYENFEKQVLVKTKETIEVNVKLNPGGQLNEVVITVQARGQMAAMREQVASNKIVNIISSEKMLELPDANAAEAIGRLPGISLQRSSGEASKVVIRGVSAAQNNVTIAGVKMASTNSGDRSADLSMIQSEMLSGVEVSKTLRADMDAGATGGTVDMRLATAATRPTFNAMQEGGYNNLFSNIGSYKSSVGGSARFLKNKFGAKIQGTFEQKQLSSQRFNAAYSGPELRQELDSDGNLSGEEYFIARTQSASLAVVETMRERMGVSLVLDFKSPFYEVSFLNLVNKKTDNIINRDENHSFVNSFNPFRLTASAGVFENINTTHLLENKIRFLGTELNLSLAHTYVKTSGFNQIFPFVEFSTTTPFIDQDDLIFTKPKYLLDLYGGANISDNKLVSDDRNTSELIDKNYDINIDWRIPFELENMNIKGVFSIGGKYHLLKRESNQEQLYVDYLAGRGQATRAQYLEQFPGLDWPAGDTQGILATNFVDANYNPGTFLNGQYNLNWSPDINLMKNVQSELYAENPDLFRGRGQQSYQNDYSNREEQIAAYVMTELNIGKLLLVPGIRMEKVNTDYKAFAILTNPVNTNGITGIPDSISEKRDNHLLFPSINAKYQFGKSIAIRGAAYKSVTRPGFIQLSPKTVITPSQPNFSSGNPFLEPATAWNYDISLEVYNSKFGLLTVNPFYKQINDFVVFLPNYFPLRNERIVAAPEGFVAALPGVDFYPIEDLANDGRTGIPVNNNEKAVYYGIELSYQKNFRNLSNKVLKGFVLDVNITVIESKTKYPYFENVVIGIDNSGFIPRDIIGYEYSLREGKVAGQPSFISNVILGWDYKGFSSRISYRFQGKTLSGLDAKLSFEDGYTDEFQMLDVSFTQRIAKGLDIYLNASNLTNHIDKDYRIYPGNLRMPLNNQYYGSRAQLGARYRF
jgi:TonB-dependent receptor